MPSFTVVSPDTHSERQYDLGLSIRELKAKLETVTGIPIASQLLRLFRSEAETTPISVLDEDIKMLGYYIPPGNPDRLTIRVEDLNPSENLTGQFTDLSQVEKFELSKEEYEKRTDTVKAYKERNKMGRFAPSEASSAPSAPIIVPSDVKPGARCEIAIDHQQKRGTIRFVGETQFGRKQGEQWIGVEYDEPQGKNDGSVQGVRYFECLPLYGGFVKYSPDTVKVGDYPPIDPFAEDEEI